MKSSPTGPAIAHFATGAEIIACLDLPRLLGESCARLPYVLRILFENAARRAPLDEIAALIQAFRGWLENGRGDVEIPFLPNRIMMHDTTCGPALVDIAAMRDVLFEHGCDPAALKPQIPVDVSTDHSSGVDFSGRNDSFQRNLAKEFERNAERYRLMKWAADMLPGFHVHPPGSGIMHTINLERLSKVVVVEQREEGLFAFPDALLGTDSHTPMINGLGVLGWGVGGLEAEGALFGVPALLRIPKVVGVKLTGQLSEGVLATDLALTVTEQLRKIGVLGAFVEFFGPGVSGLSIGERAAVANMAPEYGATTGYFPIDDACCIYLAGIGRPGADIDLVRDYAKRAGLWFDAEGEPRFTRSITIDLSEIRPSVAGPRRPQDRLPAGETRRIFDPPLKRSDGSEIPDGAIAIAAITSCTNTSDPRLLIAAGLLARNARRVGMRPPPHWVKTSLAPGSPSAERLLVRAGVMEDLEALGFGIVGYGCTTCIGNSGALNKSISDQLAKRDFRPVAVLSGNRNFPGRVHPDLDMAFLASPPMVIAFALAGSVDIDIMNEPVGSGRDGAPVRLADIWPSGAEIDAALLRGADPSDYEAAYREAAENPFWRKLDAPRGERFAWNPRSTYLRRPPFVRAELLTSSSRWARPLLVLGDDITTDHISPANQIRAESEAGRYLVTQGDDPCDLNVFASRRGNFEVMVRGAFTNRLVVNHLAPTAAAGLTLHASSGDLVSLPEAARRYAAEGTPLVIVAGQRYGMGSSRDWAAKAVALLGVRAVIASSIERIHRTNLIGMGVLPLLLPEGIGPLDLALSSTDQFAIDLSFGSISPRCKVRVMLCRADGEVEELTLQAAIETSLEVELLRSGGIIPRVLAGEIARQRRQTVGAA
ncbi:aconitate hydratase AcnA [Terrarubrum flagellatum]|uniref:aconitate hydratase AcnA n=1 Tax=Terrirubrum flagellatum TaxID=2895980 RepID=UPI003144E4F7